MQNPQLEVVEIGPRKPILPDNFLKEGVKIHVQLPEEALVLMRDAHEDRAALGMAAEIVLVLASLLVSCYLLRTVKILFGK